MIIQSPLTPDFKAEHSILTLKAFLATHEKEPIGLNIENLPQLQTGTANLHRERS